MNSSSTLCYHKKEQNVLTMLNHMMCMTSCKQIKLSIKNKSDEMTEVHNPSLYECSVT